MSTPFLISYSLLWLLVAAESVLLFALLRELGRTYLGRTSSVARDGLAEGELIPDITVATSYGPRSLHSLIKSSGRSALLFTASNCPFCPEAIMAVERVTKGDVDLGGIVFVESDVVAAYSRKYEITVAGIDSDAARQMLRVRATPFVMIVAEDGAVLARGLVNRESDLTGLMAGLSRRSNKSGAKRSPAIEIAHGRR